MFGVQENRLKSEKMAYLAYASAWISTAAAVVYGIYITHSAGCLWTFLIPAMISLTKSKDN